MIDRAGYHRIYIEHEGVTVELKFKYEPSENEIKQAVKDYFEARRLAELQELIAKKIELDSRIQELK